MREESQTDDALPLTTSMVLRVLENYKPGDVINWSMQDFSQVDLYDRTVRKALTQALKIMEETGFGHIDLSYANLRGRDFSSYRLSNIIFSGANLEHAIFAQSDLMDTQLDGANLDFADFRAASLRYAKLFGASIKGTNFSRADLTDAYGLYLSLPKEQCIKRLGVVANLHGAVLPEKAEPYRVEIEALIEKRYPGSVRFQAVKAPKVSSSVFVPYISTHPDDFNREEAW